MTDRLTRLLMLFALACGPKNAVVMPKPIPMSGEWRPFADEATSAFVKAHPGHEVFSMSFDPPTWTTTENKAIGASYRVIVAWVGARSDAGCFAYKSAFRATMAPDRSFTPLDWYADRDMAPVRCSSPFGK